MANYVSRRARVHESATYLGEGCVILGPSHIGDGCFIGSDVVIGHPYKGNLSGLKTGEGWDALDELSSGAKIGMGCTIRSGTIIYEEARLGDGVKTGHYALIRERSTVGDGTLVGSYAALDGEVHVGQKVSIQTGAYLPKGTVIEDNVFLGPFVTITNDRYPPSSKLIGVRVCKNAVIGARAILVAGVKIGENSIIGAGAVVTKDVPEDVLALGVPARVVGSREEFLVKKREYQSS